MTTATPRTDAVFLRFADPVERAYELRLLAQKLEVQFDLQRANYLALYGAVVGDGTFAGMPDAISIAIGLRAQAALDTTRFREMQAAGERLEAEVAAAKADKARLDWLQEHACEEGRTMAMPRYSFRVKQWEGAPGANIRAAIDAARNS